jgi:hypothetical protein
MAGETTSMFRMTKCRPRGASRRLGLAAAGVLVVLGGPAAAQIGSGAGSCGITRLPAGFVENLGQWDGSFRFRADLGAMTVFVDPAGFTVAVEQRRGAPEGSRGVGLVGTGRGLALRLRFVGGRASGITPAEPAGFVHHYLVGGDPARWRTHVPVFESVTLHDVLPGVAVRAHAQGSAFKYDLLLETDGDLAAVTIEVAGADRLEIDGSGRLVMATAFGPLIQPPPDTWEVDQGGRRRRVPCGFRLVGPSAFGFEAPRWNRSLPLVVDPLLIDATTLGGNGDDEALAVDAGGGSSPTIAGLTSSADFPATLGAYSTTAGGGADVFVARFTGGTMALSFATFIGGTFDDVAYALAVDGAGAITVAGRTGSANFPTTAGAFDTTFNGGLFDAFVLRLAPAGDALAYATLLGGSNDDYAFDLALDATDAATVAGHTHSADFPATPGSFDGTMGGVSDAYVLRLDASGATLAWAAFLGGGGEDYAFGIGLDASGGAVVAGRTGSADFPVTAGAFDGSFNGGVWDAFLVRVGSDGATLAFATYLGGVADDLASDVVLDAAGAAVISGWTASADFPATAGAFDATHNGGTDAFVARLAPAAGPLAFATFVGGTGDDLGYGIAVDATGAPVLAGQTLSADFPVTAGAFDATYGGAGDAFLARLSAGGSGLVHATYVGGSGTDQAYAVALSPTGDATVAGGAGAPGFPAPSHGGGGADAFVARFAFPYTLWIDQPAGNSWIRLANSGGSPGNNYVNAITTVVGAAPNGWFYGIDIPLYDLVGEILFGPPFFGTLGAGGTAITIVPGPIPLITVEVVSLELVAGTTLAGVTAPFSYTTVP